MFCFVFTVNKGFFIFKCFSLSVTSQSSGSNQGSWDYTTIQTAELSRGRQYNQNFTTNRSSLWEWEDSIVSLPVQFLTFIMWPSKRRVPQIWWVLCEADPRGEILTLAGSIFHPKSLETGLQIIYSACSLYQMVGSWLSFTTDLGQTWTRDQEMKGFISHYQ